MKWSQFICIMLLAVATVYMGFVPSQNDFPGILISGLVAFAGYGYLSTKERPSFQAIFIVGALIRIILLFAFPNLSDDIYRFLWDGQLTSLGVNPYGHLPSELMDSSRSGLSIELFHQMNSPDYYTIYPPLAQSIFYISSWFGEDSYNMSLAIKFVFLIAELFTLLGLSKILDALRMDRSLSILYFLNPLIMVEGMVNLHFEIIMIVFLIWGIYFMFLRRQVVIAAFFFALSIASKLLPVMFLPFFLFTLKGSERIRFFSWGTVFICALFSPIVLGLDFQNFGASLDLYFQKFEFNASVYYVFRYLGRLLSGYNLIHYIGPILGLLAMVLIIRKAFHNKENDIRAFFRFAFFSFVTYLMLATTVHPWYLCVPIVLTVFVRWRFTVVWSFFILLTYINYSYFPYWENLWVVSLEYLVVFTFFYYEYRKRDHLQNNRS